MARYQQVSTLASEIVFCPQCGMLINTANLSTSNWILYRLQENNERSYSITVSKENILFVGDFWYLKDKEFVRCKNKHETVLIQNFLGMGYMKKRSFRKCILFVIAGSTLEVVKMVIDKLTQFVDKANSYLQWIDKSISLPDWVNYTMNILVVVCILLAVVLFFSKKKVIEISFTDKRICVPQKSMSQNEYKMLYKSIMNVRNIK